MTAHAGSHAPLDLTLSLPPPIEQWPLATRIIVIGATGVIAWSAAVLAVHGLVTG